MSTTYNAMERRTIPFGTAFPSSPATDDLHYRSDRDILYVYDGTRWLCTCPHQEEVTNVEATTPQPYTATGSNIMRGRLSDRRGFSIFVNRIEWTWLVVNGGTALSASHMWVATFVAQPGGATLATLTADSGASGTWFSVRTAHDGVVADTELAYQISVTKTGTPGNLRLLPVIAYRLVG